MQVVAFMEHTGSPAARSQDFFLSARLASCFLGPRKTIPTRLLGPKQTITAHNHHQFLIEILAASSMCLC